MIRRLFARLTGEPRRGQKLFDAAAAEARKPHWFVEGQVPDTVDGRFAMLATIVALLIVRLERGGPAGEAGSVALTERFVETLDTEIREMGLGDPALGKQVRQLVGALAARVERWRSVLDQGLPWRPATERSIYRDQPPGAAAIEHSEAALRSLWRRIENSSVEALVEGRLA